MIGMVVDATFCCGGPTLKRGREGLELGESERRGGRGVLARSENTRGFGEGRIVGRSNGQGGR